MDIDTLKIIKAKEFYEEISQLYGFDNWNRIIDGFKDSSEIDIGKSECRFNIVVRYHHKQMSNKEMKGIICYGVCLCGVGISMSPISFPSKSFLKAPQKRIPPRYSVYKKDYIRQLKNENDQIRKKYKNYGGWVFIPLSVLEDNNIDLDTLKHSFIYCRGRWGEKTRNSIVIEKIMECYDEAEVREKAGRVSKLIISEMNLKTRERDLENRERECKNRIEKVTSQSDNLDRLYKAINNLDKYCDKLIHQFLDDNEEKKKEYIKAEQELNESKKRVENSKEELQSLSDTIEKQEEEKKAKEKERNLLTDKQKDLESEIAGLNEEIKKLDQQIEELKGECDWRSAGVVELEADLADYVDRCKTAVDEKKKEKEKFERIVKEHEQSIIDGKRALYDFERKHLFNTKKASVEVEANYPEGISEYVSTYLFSLHRRCYPEEERIIPRFLSAVGSGQIILLAGKPGCGKSTLPVLIGEAIGAEVVTVTVQPNWTDSQDILGYYNHKDGSYIHTPFLDALIGANKKDDKMYFIVLDEMNLAHIEYYFSSVLSAMETEDRLIRLRSGFGRRDRKEDETKDESEQELFEIKLPTNVQFVGTVNMDELSKSISPKVLDRSCVIELSYRDGITPDPVDIKTICEVKKSTFSAKCFTGYDEEPNLHSKEVEEIQKVYDKLGDFYDKNRASIIGLRPALSHRGRMRSSFMLSHGTNPGDIVLSRLLPTLNWEMPEELFSDLKKLFEENVVLREKRIIEKLEAMKDDFEDRVVLDYWLESGR